MAQIATAWVLSKPGVTAPIIGTTSLKTAYLLYLQPPPGNPHEEETILRHNSRWWR